MTHEAFNSSPESAEKAVTYETADSPGYLDRVADVASRLGYEGPQNRSLYELAMRMTGGQPEPDTVRDVVRTAHEAGLISDEFNSSKLTIFRHIGDNSMEIARGGRPEEDIVRNEPLWQRVVNEAGQMFELMPAIYGDPDTLWADISCLYGFTLEDTFNTVAQREKEEIASNSLKLKRGELTPNTALYTASIWACHDNFSTEQLPVDAYGKGVDWE